MPALSRQPAVATTSPACVDAWTLAVADLPATDLLRAFESALGAIWSRAQRTLGVVTLLAVGRRVALRASETTSLPLSIRADTSGWTFDDLRARVESLDVIDLRASMALVLLDVVTVLGTLTAEVLTSDLHATLREATPVVDSFARRIEPTVGPEENGPS